LLFCACVLLSIFSPALLPALTESETELLQSIVADMLLARQSLAVSARALTDSQASLTEQGQLLRESTQRVSRLSAQLQLWREHSTELDDSLGRLSSELATLRQELRRLTDTYNALLTQHDDYSRQVDARILATDRRVRAWRIGALAGSAAALALGFLLGLLVPG
jgi:septal ring factor EnvC (AmiA/AmiB activator)